jgi:DNA helicase II / ATP-dependent DNA helicase PcrA
MDASMQSLTQAQREAVVHQSGPLLILAGPGSGKTRVVTHRIAHLLEQGVPPRQLLALTFTNKAADEMRSRLAKLAPEQPVWMGTFHRFCARLLRQYARLVGLQPNYSIYDTSDSKAALQRSIDAAQIVTSHVTVDQIASAISRLKNRLIFADRLDGLRGESPRETLALRAYPVYQRHLQTANAVDFDDLLLHVARMLADYPELRGELDAQYRYVMVDEYQDTNYAQYTIARGLSIDHPNLAVTGDPDQSIYSWRGADIRNILDFEHDYPAAKIVRLEQNYRSTPEILRVADSLIRHNRHRKHKQLFTVRNSGAAVRLRMYESGRSEADHIADQIGSAIRSGTRRLCDFAIFYRVSWLSRTIEQALRSRVLPYQVARGVEFYQRKEIKDVLAYLHLINNPSHDVALQRVINYPTRGIGDKTIERLRSFADEKRMPLLEAARQAGMVPGIATRTASVIAKFVAMFDMLQLKAAAPVADLLVELLEVTGLKKHLEDSALDDIDDSPLANVQELVQGAEEYDHQHPHDGSLEGFLEDVALVSDTDAWEGAKERITLMTLHASKGLEFPCVFVIGVEQDILPHSRSKDDPSQFEEERRLLFVGITRAEDELQLSTSRRRSIHGSERPTAPSPFLFELPREEMDVTMAQEAHRFSDVADPGFDNPFIDQEPADDDWDQSSTNSHDLADDIAQDVELNGGEARTKAPSRVRGKSSMPPSRAPRKPLSLQTLKTGAELAARPNAEPLEPALAVGQRVAHPQHGVGRVEQVSGVGRGRRARVMFEGESSARTFVLAMAPLSIVADETT